MAENKMEQVAKLLGLELEEEFKLKEKDTNYIIHTKYKLTQNGLMGLSEIDNKWWYSTMLQHLLTGQYEIIKIPKQILDEKEKEYLSAVIKPFRNQVISISKKLGDYGEFIDIEIEEAEYSDGIYLPYFKPNSMYKGMKLYKDYTIKELGL